MTLIQSIQHPSRIQDVRFCRHPHDLDATDADELLFVSAEDKKVSVYASRPEFVKAKAMNGEEDEEEEEEAPADAAYGIVAELIGHANRYVPSIHASLGRTLSYSAPIKSF